VNVCWWTREKCVTLFLDNDFQVSDVSCVIKYCLESLLEKIDVKSYGFNGKHTSS